MMPIILEWHQFILYSYPLFLGLSWGLGYQVSRHYAVHHPVTKVFAQREFYGVIAGLFCGSWVFAKLFFLLFSRPEWAQMENLSFWVGGGLVYYGGLLGGILFLAIYCGVRKLPFFKVAKVFLPGLCFAHALGRVGCFLAGCCYGSSTQSLFSITHNGMSRHPVQLYEAGLLSILGIFLVLMIKRNKVCAKNLTGIYLVGYALIRWPLELLRDDSIRGVWTLGSTSQITAIVMLSFGFILFLYRRSPNKEASS